MEALTQILCPTRSASLEHPQDGLSALDPVQPAAAQWRRGSRTPHHLRARQCFKGQGDWADAQRGLPFTRKASFAIKHAGGHRGPGRMLLGTPSQPYSGSKGKSQAFPCPSGSLSCYRRPPTPMSRLDLPGHDGDDFQAFGSTGLRSLRPPSGKQSTQHSVLFAEASGLSLPTELPLQ